MIITCEACNVRFQLDESLLSPSGSKVRCSKCKHVFTVYPPPPPEPAEDTDTGSIPPETDTDDEDLGLDLPDSPTEGDLADASTQDEAPDADADAGEDLDLDLGLDLGEDTPEAGTTGRNIEDIDLDTDQIDEATAVAEMEDMDLSLDLDGPPAEKALPGAAEDPLEELDFDLESADADLSDVTVDELIEDVDIEDAIEASSDAADDLGDLDLDLGLAEAADEPEAPRPAEVEEEPDLEPLGFDLDFGEEPQDRTTASAAADDLGDIEGLDLDFMEEPEDLTLAKAPAGDAQDLEELDLDLGLDADETDEFEPEAEADLEADLDLSELESAVEPSAEEVDEGLDEMDDLELDLDLDAPAEATVADAGMDTAPVNLADDLDLSDLETVLDGMDTDTDLGRAFDDTDEQDLELDLGLDEEDHAGMAAAREVADELDFSDIEDLLEDSDAAEAEATDTGELELDLDLDLDEEPTTEDADIYDIAETQPTESADEDLAFELEDDEIEDLEGFGETIILAPEEQRAAVEAAHGDRPRPPAAPVRRARDREFHAIDRVEPKANARLGKPILIVILLALLGAGLFVATRVLNIHIPFLSGLTSTQAPDPGNVNFSTFGINSMFVDNQKLDKLFVISGKIRNDYPTARKAVKIDGKLYAKGKKLAATEAVYAGNVISGPDLAVIDKDGIQQRLSKPDTTVAAGEVASFMVIFTNLPDDLEEFTIEVASSSE